MVISRRRTSPGRRAAKERRARVGKEEAPRATPLVSHMDFDVKTEQTGESWRWMLHSA